MPIDALSVLCAQLTRDLLAIAKFLFFFFCSVLKRRWMHCIACTRPSVTFGAMKLNYDTTGSGSRYTVSRLVVYHAKPNGKFTKIKIYK